MIFCYLKLNNGIKMKIYKYIFKKSDGREWIQYADQPFTDEFLVKDEGLIRPSDWTPPTMRYNKMRDEWVAISPSRNSRPFLPPKEYCPLCPVTEFGKDSAGQLIKTDVPITNQTYQWAAFENMFPGVAEDNETGYSEVILYSNEHNKTLASCSEDHIEGLIRVWQDRSAAIGSKQNIECVFIFENKGAEVGVTLHHPHGQIYAFGHVPPFIAKELEVSKEYFEEKGECLLCRETIDEISHHERIVFETSNIIAWVPEAARYPYEVHITSKTHRALIEDLNEQEVKDLALTLKVILGKYNQVAKFEFPYIMVHHQAPHTELNCPFYHWHIEFYPPYRSKGKLKFLAGVESGTGLFINDTIPEEKAEELRNLNWK